MYLYLSLPEQRIFCSWSLIVISLSPVIIYHYQQFDQLIHITCSGVAHPRLVESLRSDSKTSYMDQIKIDICFGCLSFDIDTTTAIKYDTVSLKMNPTTLQREYLNVDSWKMHTCLSSVGNVQQNRWQLECKYMQMHTF